MWKFKKYVHQTNEIQDCLESVNELMKQCISDSGDIIKRQSEEIKQLKGEEIDNTSNVKCGKDAQISSIITDEKKKLNLRNQEGWNIFLVRRNASAPPLSLYDMQSAIVIAQTYSEVIDILKENDSFVDDEWWDIVQIFVNESTRGVVLSKYGV